MAVTQRPHAGHGVRQPGEGTPVRQHPSARRTISLDIVRPDGLAGDLLLAGRARDLHTGTDGTARILDAATMEATVEFPASRVIRTLRTSPQWPGSTALVGARASSGFRTALQGLDPDRGRSALFQLLDDIPVATLIAGQAQLAEREVPGTPQLPIAVVANVCAGWRDGGVMATGLAAGRAPVVYGPPAPSLADPDDPLAWHDMAPGEPTMMRRSRRLDVVPTSGGWLIEAFLRDSHWPGSGPARGGETVIHEYLVRARLSTDLVIIDLEVIAHVLPWQDCLPAAARPRELVGTRLDDLDARVRAEFMGTSSCTHLNDILRSLAGVRTLAGAVAGW